MYENVIKIFEDTIEDNVFETLSFNLAKSKLQNSNSNLKILTGVAGSGKTFLVKHIFNDAILLKPILTKEDIDNNLDENRLIVIDEAQLLDIQLIEYIRVLSDTKKYNFLLVMHKKDANEILNKEHFKSRNIEVIELSPISKEEMIQYINVKLLSVSANVLLTKKEFDIIYNYTNGNFRYIKKFLKTLFELLDFAVTNHIKKHMNINRCLLTMSAIKLGLEDA